MKLFDEINRVSKESAKYSEPEFKYLNHSARHSATKIRQVLEEWFSRYPDEGKTDLRERFRHKDDSNHRSAFFELFLHELLKRLGCKVVIHPRVSNTTTKHPDFLIESPSGGSFYMEAICATGESKAETAARAIMNDVYDNLSKLDSLNFFIETRAKGSPKSSPSTKKMINLLNEQLNQLDPDNIEKLINTNGIDAIPHWNFKYEGGNIDISPFPKSCHLRGKKGIPPIGIQFHGLKKPKSREAIKDAILSKSGYYGNLNLPYVIAVNAICKHVKQRSIIEALFGEEQFITELMTSTQEKTYIKIIPNGAWTSESGPRYTRVSAALIVASLQSWNIPRANICLYHNPWAKRPYKSELTRLPQAVPKDDKMQWIDGESLSDIFNLPLGWPEE